ncbi:MAG: glycosyltransferase family 2 protein [Lentisphaerae bacterium]|nr:glycosyltransferase family 2 protein [Lentisphaerota bacterium]
MMKPQHAETGHQEDIPDPPRPPSCQPQPNPPGINPFLSVAILNYNEIHTLEEAARTAARVLALMGVTHEIVLVDDGSSDGSRNLITHLVEVLPHCRAVLHRRNLGIGEGIRTCYFTSRGEWSTWFPADLQADLNELPRLAAGLTDCDALITYRDPRSRKEPMYRKAISACDRLLVRFLFGIQVRDLHWIRFFRRSLLDRMTVQCRSPFVDTEMLAMARMLNARVKEAPLDDQIRKSGVGRGALPKNLVASFKEMVLLAWRGGRILPPGDAGQIDLSLREFVPPHGSRRN